MLDRLDVQDGQTVLEIGAGTGYNAALLCRHLGADRVTSVDINPTLVEQASTRLAQAGYRPRLEAVDGSTALPGNARHGDRPRLLADPDFLLWVELHLRHPQISILTEDTTELHVWTARGLAVVPTTSSQEDPPRWTVRQHGDQRPWDTIEVAHRSWQEHGRPSRERLGITATADLTRQRVWLDEPQSPCSWPLPL